MTIFLSLATFCSAVSAVSKWGLVDNFMCFVFKTSVISNNCPWFTSLFYRFLFHFEISVSVTSLPAFSPPSLVWTTESAAAFHHIFMILVFSSFLFFIYTCFQVFSSCMTFSHFHGLWLLLALTCLSATLPACRPVHDLGLFLQLCVWDFILLSCILCFGFLLQVWKVASGDIKINKYRKM